MSDNVYEDDIVHILRISAPYEYTPVGYLLNEAADEIEKLRKLIIEFVSAWERSEIGEQNSAEYFNAVHAMRKAVHGE